jgi:hypothetical protein
MKAAEEKSMALLNSKLIISDYLNEGLTTRNHRRSLIERFKIMTHHYGLLSTCLHHLWFVVR